MTSSNIQHEPYPVQPGSPRYRVIWATSEAPDEFEASRCLSLKEAHVYARELTKDREVIRVTIAVDAYLVRREFDVLELTERNLAQDIDSNYSDLEDALSLFGQRQQ